MPTYTNPLAGRGKSLPASADERKAAFEAGLRAQAEAKKEADAVAYRHMNTLERYDYTDKRLASLPDVPTLKEQGVNLTDGSYRGYLAPKSTPREIIEVLADGMEKVSQDPQHKAACAAQNMSAAFMKGAAFKTFLAKNDEMLRVIVKEMNLGK